MVSTRFYPTVILLVCLAALAGALTAQFGFGLRPCVLCLYQRVPYATAAVLAAMALLLPLPPRARQALVALCAVAFAVNVGIAVFHVGVEQHWWEGTAACVGGGRMPNNPQEMMAMLAGPPPARCDQIPWSLFGISMAGYNVVVSLVLAGFSGWAARRLSERRA